MIENKKNLVYKNDGREGIDLELYIEASTAFGWNVDSINPHPNYKGGQVVECSRDTDMKNYVELKALEENYEAALKILQDGKMVKVKEKIVSTNIFSGIVPILLIVFGLIFGLAGTAATVMFAPAVVFIGLAVLLILKKNKDKVEVQKQYNALSSIVTEAKSLL